ncbi:flagellar biosynthesis repressor FlbT [Methylobacterium sp. Gmos1]
MRLSLRAGERIYINGAVLRVDRKVAVELLNDATFLLESHVLQAEDATTPLRQLYFAAQTMLIDPGRAAAARELYDGLRDGLLATTGEAALRDGLAAAHGLIENGRLFEALKLIRGLYPLEAALMTAGAASPAPAPGPGLTALARRPRVPDRPRERAAMRPPAVIRRTASPALPAREPEA